MGWIQTLTIIITFFILSIGTTFSLFIFIANKVDNLSKEINSIKMEVLWIKFRLDPNEHSKWNHVEPKEIE